MRVGRPIPFRAKSAQPRPLPSRLARDDEEMPPRPARARAEGEGGGRDMGAKREGADGVECTGGGWQRRRGGKGRARKRNLNEVIVKLSRSTRLRMHQLKNTNRAYFIGR